MYMDTIFAFVEALHPHFNLLICWRECCMWIYMFSVSFSICNQGVLNTFELNDQLVRYRIMCCDGCREYQISHIIHFKTIWYFRLFKCIWIHDVWNYRFFSGQLVEIVDSIYVLWLKLVLFSSKTHQPGGEMLLSFNNQQSPSRLHQRAQIHPHAKLPLPSDVSIVVSAALSEWRPHKHAFLCVFHPGIETSHRFPLFGTFLTINLWGVAGQRKELCMHVHTHAPLSLAFTHTCTERK